MLVLGGMLSPPTYAGGEGNRDDQQFVLALAVGRAVRVAAAGNIHEARLLELEVARHDNHQVVPPGGLGRNVLVQPRLRGHVDHMGLEARARVRMILSIKGGRGVVWMEWHGRSGRWEGHQGNLTLRMVYEYVGSGASM